MYALQIFGKYYKWNKNKLAVKKNSMLTIIRLKFKSLCDTKIRIFRMNNVILNFKKGDHQNSESTYYYFIPFIIIIKLL